MTFYSRLAAKTSSLLQRRGQQGTVTRAVVAGGGPTDAAGGSVTETGYTARMAVFPVSQDRIDGTNIKAGDYQAVIEAIGIEITADDKVTCSFGTDMTIVQTGKIAPAGVTVAYDAIIRGA